MEVFTTALAQPHVLREKMREKELSHGETVKANLSPVRLESAYGKVHMYFCPMKAVEVLERMIPGDGGEIPDSVFVEVLRVPPCLNDGLYTLRNVNLSSNGSIQV